MLAVITGDIVNSRQGQVTDWLKNLKEILNQYGKEPKQWEIFRGDSFQLALTPENALLAAIHIKAGIKQTKAQDVRMAIGLGSETHTAQKITESNGTAYVLSGDCFDLLKKHTLALRSTNVEFDKLLNIMISLALLTANSWSTTVAQVVKMAIEYPEKSQKEIAQILNKSQSSVSEALKRGGFEEIMSLNNFYQIKISEL